MKTVATLDGQHPQVNIPKIMLKHATKKPDIECVIVVVTPTYKPTSLMPTQRNMTGLWQSEQLKNKEQISYSEEIGDH